MDMGLNRHGSWALTFSFKRDVAFGGQRNLIVIKILKMIGWDLGRYSRTDMGLKADAPANRLLKIKVKSRHELWIVRVAEQMDSKFSGKYMQDVVANPPPLPSFSLSFAT